MEGEAAFRFSFWWQEDSDLDRESSSIALMERFRTSGGSHVFEEFTILKQEVQVERKTDIEKWRTRWKHQRNKEWCLKALEEGNDQVHSNNEMTKSVEKVGNKGSFQR